MAKTKRGIENISDTEQQRQRKTTRTLSKKGQKRFQGTFGAIRNVSVDSLNFFDLEDAAGESLVLMGRR